MTALATDLLTVGSSKRTIRVGRWPATSSPRAVVLLFNGLTEFMEKYQEVADDLIARDLEVLSLDWGGQGLSDRLLENPQKVHTRDYADRLDEADALVAWGRDHIAEKPVVLLGHSMGGHIALRVAVERPPARLGAVALSAPMISFPPLPGSNGLLNLLVWGGATLGLRERYAPGRGDYNERIATVRAYLMSSDTRRVRFQEKLWPGDSAHRLGGVTWGWLQASLASCSLTQRSGYFDGLDCPMLLGVAGRDVLVSNRAALRMANTIKNCTVVRYEESLHEILMERDETRDRFLSDFDMLLDRAGI